MKEKASHHVNMMGGFFIIYEDGYLIVGMFFLSFMKGLDVIDVNKTMSYCVNGEGCY